MIKKHIIDYGRECYSGVQESTLMSDLEFHRVLPGIEDDVQYALHTNIGSLTVLNRMTSFGYRDVKTGYRNMEGKFWLASGGYDVRNCRDITIGEAIQWVKDNANNCKGE